MMNNGATSLRQVVVVGAGIAGLVSARVLSDYADRVIVIDRDTLPQGPDERKGVPQGGHAHGLLAVGQGKLESLFPGLLAELAGHGAVLIDVGRDLALWQLGGYRASSDTGVTVISVTRPLLEWCIRCRVVALPNVTVRDGTAVASLTGNYGTGVNGVTLADGGEVVTGQLVVDASGRGERSDKWLQALGFETPEVSMIKVNIGYATTFLDRHEADLGNAIAAAIAPTPPADKRFGVAMPVNGERWLVTLGGFHADYPPTDQEGYKKFAQSLSNPLIGGLLDRAGELGEIAAYRYPASRWRHFERPGALPAGYVAVGDSVCSFNPVYGQGMTIAVLEAVVLGEALARRAPGPVALGDGFGREVKRVVGAAWELARGADFWYPETVGARPSAVRFRNWYMRKVIKSAQTSTDVNETLIRVQHLLAGPESLLKPSRLIAALRARG